MLFIRRVLKNYNLLKHNMMRRLQVAIEVGQFN